jgi:hypothetical protein
MSAAMPGRPQAQTQIGAINNVGCRRLIELELIVTAIDAVEIVMIERLAGEDVEAL